MDIGRTLAHWIAAAAVTGCLTIGGCASQPPAEPERPDVLGRAAELVAERSGHSPDELEILRVEEVTWPSAALGCPDPEKVYAQVTTPGFRIILGSPDRVHTWELHTNEDATAIVHCRDGRPAS
jgi:hypothetical protein